MKALRFYFLIVLAAMLGVTTWASLQVALWKTPREVATHPWFIATLFDAYFGFLAFWLWVAWRETKWSLRILWLLLILLLGNITMAVYVLIRLAKLPKGAGFRELLLRDA